MSCNCTECGCAKEKTVPYSELKEMAAYYLSLMEGDTHRIDDAHAFMHKHGIVDEDGFEIYDDDEVEDIGRPVPDHGSGP